MPKKSLTSKKAANQPFYITTTLPYVNGDPHIGFAMEIIRADIIARSKKAAGHEVFFNTGTDEHGLKIYRKAQSDGITPQDFVDKLAEKYKSLLQVLGILPEVTFTRTTDKLHIESAQEFWKTADKNGLIYKKKYKIKYCVGCELEKTESELVDDHCSIHPLQELEIIEEENYFFRFSIFQKSLMDLYDRENFVVPRSRLNEIRAFVERGLEDFSISRLASKMPWGVPVPGDSDQVMYVWFDALVNYISAIGWPHDQKTFNKWWIETGGVVQYCGKDNLRQQAAMWQTMLIGLKLPPSKQIIINGFITGEGGIKMSKSIGNTVDPFEIVNEFGMDALRYYVARELHPFEDSAFSKEKFTEAYNAHLANGLGNLVSRIMKMSEGNAITISNEVYEEIIKSSEIKDLLSRQNAAFDAFDIQSAANTVWELITNTDKIVQLREPFKKIKTDKAAAEKDMLELLARLKIIAEMLGAILPITSAKILDLVAHNKMPDTALFMRK